MIGSKDFKTETPSLFVPSREVRELTARVKDDYQTGDNIQNQSYAEFNDMSVLNRSDRDQKLFNSYVEPQSGDAEESWRFNGTRPITRAKIIGMAGQATANTLYPNFFAQNDQDEGDKEASQVMRDLVELHIRNSDYEVTFLYGVIAALVNPCAYLSAQYTEAVQTIKVRMANGDMTTKDVLDETFSGLQTNLVPLDEVLIANAYEFNHQKQRFVIRKRIIDYSEALSLWGEHENFIYVKPGVNNIYSRSNGQFYQDYDEENPTLVEEVIYYNRQEDSEIPFINGIYMGDEDVNKNMFRNRRVTRDVSGEAISVPIYGEAKFGFEPIDEKRFYYYKSAVSKIAPEQDLVDTMWRMTMDGTFLSVMPPIIATGGDSLDSGVIYPGAVTSLEEETQINKLDIGANLSSGYQAISALEKSINESTQDPLREGSAGESGRTAFEVSRIEENARINFSIFGKMLASAVVQVGERMADIIIQHMTVAEVEETLGGASKLKFRQFLLPDQSVDGKKMTKVIRFQDSLIGHSMTDEEVKNRQKELLKEGGGLNGDMSISEINPNLFAKLKFKTVVSADDFLPKNESFERAFKLQAYDRMIQNPTINIQTVTRDFLVEPFAGGDADKYMGQAQAALGQDFFGPEKGRGGESDALVEELSGNSTLDKLIQQQ
jgi:hypothetical protein